MKQQELIHITNNNSQDQQSQLPNKEPQTIKLDQERGSIYFAASKKDTSPSKTDTALGYRIPTQ